MQVEINKMTQVIRSDEKMLQQVARKAKHGAKQLSSRQTFEETWYRNAGSDLADSLKGTVTKGIDVLEMMKQARKQY